MQIIASNFEQSEIGKGVRQSSLSPFSRLLPPPNRFASLGVIDDRDRCYQYEYPPMKRSDWGKWGKWAAGKDKKGILSYTPYQWSICVGSWRAATIKDDTDSHRCRVLVNLAQITIIHLISVPKKDFVFRKIKKFLVPSFSRNSFISVHYTFMSSSRMLNFIIFSTF
jgi:hypothetical protein